MPSLLLCNPRSLNNRIDELSAVLDNNTVDVAAITETWFTGDQQADLNSICGYNLFSKPRPDRRGGGVALYVRENMNTKLLDVNVPEDIEVLWVSLRPNRLPRDACKIIIGVLYYPPRSPIAQKLIDHMSSTIDSVLSQQPFIEFLL